MSFHRIVFAAPKSGSGKTMLVCAFLRALQKKGIHAKSFKCGPDYIDPMFHKNVLGIDSKNLDLFFSGEEQVREHFVRDNDADISVIEGVMGLFDGMEFSSSRASTYHLAKTLEAPVLLVIDAKGMSRSILAQIYGFLHMDQEKLIQGIVLNRVSKHMYESIKPVIEESCGIQVLGYFPEKKELSFESRHLGLLLPQEIKDLQEKIDALAELFLQCVDFEKVLQLANQAKALEAVETDVKEEASLQVKIGIAKDEAFCFFYQDNLRELENAGAKLIFFSPLHDRELPKDIDGMIFYGGYPELYAKELEKNLSMKSSIKKAISDGVVTISECGGFMYLHDTITNEEGSFQMVGAIAGDCFYTGKLVRFGYVFIDEKKSLFLDENTQIKGHEFHYYDSTNNGSDCVAQKPVTQKAWDCIHVKGTMWAGFAHLYYPSNPSFAKNLVRRCRERHSFTNQCGYSGYSPSFFQ